MPLQPLLFLFWHSEPAAFEARRNQGHPQTTPFPHPRQAPFTSKKSLYSP